MTKEAMVVRLPSSTDVLIVGAGPAGLALARQLKRLRIEHCLVDQFDTGAAWKSMPPALHLVSPWWTNALRLRDIFRFPPFAKIGADKFHAYLRQLQKREGIPVVPDCRVDGVTRTDDGGFAVSTTQGELSARCLALCTGYFFFPAGPDPQPTSDGSVRVIHASAHPGPDEVRRIAGRRPVVIVGRRISAGQLMVELADAGVEVVLSTRSPIEFRRDGLLGELKDFVYYFYEEILLLMRPRLQAPSFPVMDGGRSRVLYKSGRVREYPAIVDISDGLVEFSDGRRLQAGLVINATGYRPRFAGLPVLPDDDGLPRCNDWESTEAPGLFFLGLDNRRNYRSRTLRGIRYDARALARRIQRRLQDGCQPLVGSS